MMLSYNGSMLLNNCSKLTSKIHTRCQVIYYGPTNHMLENIDLKLVSRIYMKILAKSNLTDAVRPTTWANTIPCKGTMSIHHLYGYPNQVQM